VSLLSRAKRTLALPGLRFGLVVAVLVWVVGWSFALQQPARWSAEAELLLAPDVSDPGLETSSFYDTLSNGQLPATAAEILSQGRFLEEIKTEYDIPDSEQVAISVTQVPETAIVRATVTAKTPAVAVLVASDLPDRTIPVVDKLLAPYSLTSVGDPEDTKTQISLARTQWAAAVAAAALLLGLAAQQLVLQLTRARRGAARPDDT
jgi:capsular polysaccharide biosynthesis protein